MSFLAPLFLIGGLLIAGPIIAHLIRRQTKNRIRFSDTRLLQPSPPRLQRRSRIENWWLLALRCLVVLVLTAGFARPFLRREITPTPDAAAPRHVVAVLDDSASMQREGVWTDAVARVNATAADLGANDRFALLTAGGEVALVIGSEQWANTPPGDRQRLVEDSLAGRTPGWGPTRLDSAIDAALDEGTAMAEAGEALANLRIVVVTDATQGARVAGLAGRNWPRGCTVEIAAISGARTADVALQWLGWTTGEGGKRVARVRLLNQTPRPAGVQLQLQAAANARDVSPAQGYQLAASESRVVLVDVPAAQLDPLRLVLRGDEEPFNNTLWLVPPQAREVAVPYFGDHEPNDSAHPLYYISRAVAGWRDPKVQVATAPGGALAENAPLVVVAATLGAEDVQRVRAHVEAGGFALVLVSDPAQVSTAAALVGETGWAAAPAPERHALLGSINFQHPLFQPFADPRYSNFSRIRFWKPVPLAIPADSKAVVAARFDDGSAAVVEAPVGEGRIVVWGGNWSNTASQWVLSTKFIPWLQALVERAAGGPPRPNIAEVGEHASLASAPDARWTNAAGETLPAPARPGVYTLVENGRPRSVALQVPVAESRTEPLPADTWEQLGIPMEARAVTAANAGAAEDEHPRQIAATDTATEAQQKYWRWMLIGAVVLLAVESLAAIRAARRQAEPAGEGQIA